MGLELRGEGRTEMEFWGSSLYGGSGIGSIGCDEMA